MNTSAGRFTAVLLAGAFLVPAGLSAQGHQAHHPETDETRAPSGMMDDGMMGQQSGMMSDRMTMMGSVQAGPRMLLHQRDVLELSEDQIDELEQLEARADELRSSHRSAMASVRERLQELRGSDEMDLDRYESLLREQAELRVEMRVRAAETHRDALEVLTDEQRSNVRYGMRMMRSMHSERGMSSGMPGDGSGMMDMKDGMGQPQMMGMMMRMHRQMHGQDCPMAADDGAGS